MRKCPANQCERLQWQQTPGCVKSQEKVQPPHTPPTLSSAKQTRRLVIVSLTSGIATVSCRCGWRAIGAGQQCDHVWADSEVYRGGLTSGLIIVGVVAVADRLMHSSPTRAESDDAYVRLHSHRGLCPTTHCDGIRGLPASVTLFDANPRNQRIPHPKARPGAGWGSSVGDSSRSTMRRRSGSPGTCSPRPLQRVLEPRGSWAALQSKALVRRGACLPMSLNAS